MIKRNLKKLATKFKEASPIMQGMIVLLFILIVGIILRWSYIVERVSASFRFLNGN